MTRRTSILSAMILSWVSSAWAEEGWELTFLGGWTAPAIEERILFGVDLDIPSVPGVVFEQDGDFGLVGSGSVAFGGAVAYFFNDSVGFEARVDSVNFRVATEGPLINGSAPAPFPLPSIGAELDLSRGAVDVERLVPLSANLRARTGGPVRFQASGGVSFLPRLRFAARQDATLSAGLSGVGLIPLATVTAEAEARSDVPFSDRIGFNGGAGFEADVSDRVSVVGEARVFRFPRQTLSWQGLTTPVSPLDGLLLDLLLDELAPLELDLIYFQVLGGISIRF